MSKLTPSLELKAALQIFTNAPLEQYMLRYRIAQLLLEVSDEEKFAAIKLLAKMGNTE